MGIGAVVGEGAAALFVAFANGATANSVQQPRKTLILREKTRLGRPTPSLWIVAVPVDEPRAISAAANKSEKQGLGKLPLFLALCEADEKLSAFLELERITSDESHRNQTIQERLASV